MEPKNVTEKGGLVFETGKNVGVSDWVVVDQNMITSFGEVTRDMDPAHINPAWAMSHSPFGGTIAFGFLTISLLSTLLYSATGVWPSEQNEEAEGYLNYGFDRVRLIEPVKVGSRVRGHFKTLQAEDDDKGRTRVKIEALIEIEGVERPALMAEWLTILVNREKV